MSDFESAHDFLSDEDRKKISAIWSADPSLNYFDLVHEVAITRGLSPCPCPRTFYETVRWSWRTFARVFDSLHLAQTPIDDGDWWTEESWFVDRNWKWLGGSSTPCP